MLLVSSIDLLANPGLEVVADETIDQVDQPLLWDLADLPLIREIFEYDGVVAAPIEDVSCAETFVLWNRQMLGILVLKIYMQLVKNKISTYVVSCLRSNPSRNRW